VGGRGRFVVLEGVDGSGKSTQAGLLARALEARGRRVLHVREPGSTPLGEKLRALVLDRAHAPSAAVEALILTAARRALLDELVAPALADGRDVVCERFHPSTYAYQGVAGGLTGERVMALLEAWAGAPAPDLIAILALDPRAAALRRGAPRDRIEDRGAEHAAAVARGYEEFAARYAVSSSGGRSDAGHPTRVVRVAADGSASEVAARIWAEVERLDVGLARDSRRGGA
jgi:dTMP kinase